MTPPPADVASVGQGPVWIDTGTVAPFHLLAKPTGAVCNLDCSYCFYLAKEALYPGSDMRMADDTLREYLRQLVEAHRDAPEIVIAWQGGEPTLMGLEFFRRSVDVVDGLLRAGQQAVHTIQTNAVTIDEEWAAFFREHRFLVGVSIDGPRDVHDAYRVGKGGRGSFDRVMHGLAHLRAAGVDWNALTTLHAANAGRGREVYRFLRDSCGARFLQLIPVVEPAARPADGSGGGEGTAGAVATSRSITGEQYGRFLIDVFEDWVRRDVGEVFVQMFDVSLANWVGEPPSLCVHSETCGRALALEHNGDVYSCDHYVDPAHLLGNVHRTHLAELVGSPDQRRFGEAKLHGLPRQCRECDVRFACHGGCPKDRLLTADDGGALNYLCDGYTAFFRHVDPAMRVMGDLLRRGLAPASITRLYAAKDALRRQDEPCTCGSGRGWADCHGSADDPSMTAVGADDPTTTVSPVARTGAGDDPEEA